jgi:predicted DNA-binding transcriptional regulator AlpA
MSDEPQPGILTVAETEPLISLSEWVVYDLIKRGLFPTPTVRLGRRVLILRAPFEAFLDGEQAPSSGDHSAGL